MADTRPDQTCGDGKCFRALRERAGGFSVYPAYEDVEIVGYSYRGGCPGDNIEYVPEEMVKNGRLDARFDFCCWIFGKC